MSAITTRLNELAKLKEMRTDNGERIDSYARSTLPSTKFTLSFLSSRIRTVGSRSSMFVG